MSLLPACALRCSLQSAQSLTSCRDIIIHSYKKPPGQQRVPLTDYILARRVPKNRMGQTLQEDAGVGGRGGRGLVILYPHPPPPHTPLKTEENLLPPLLSKGGNCCAPFSMAKTPSSHGKGAFFLREIRGADQWRPRPRTGIIANLVVVSGCYVRYGRTRPGLKLELSQNWLKLSPSPFCGGKTSLAPPPPSFPFCSPPPGNAMTGPLQSNKAIFYSALSLHCVGN